MQNDVLHISNLMRIQYNMCKIIILWFSRRDIHHPIDIQQVNKEIFLKK